MFGKVFIKKLSDIDLIEKYKKTGDNAFLGELFERYTHFIFCVCLKYFRNEEKSKDAVMQIAEKLMTDLHKHEISNFKSWLHVVVKNFCLMQLRSEKTLDKRQDLLEKDAIEIMETDNILHLDNADDLDIKIDILKEAINELDDEQKKCIDFFYLQDKSYAEVVEITGYTMNQVKSFIQNGKRNLKIYITEMYEKRIE